MNKLLQRANRSLFSIIIELKLERKIIYFSHSKILKSRNKSYIMYHIISNIDIVYSRNSE